MARKPALSSRNRGDTVTAADYQQLDYAFGKARERIEELQTQLKEAQAHATTLADIVIEHEATIQKLSFERDAQASERQMLAAKLDAVPLQAIAKVFNAADNDGYCNDDVAEWLMENGVQP